MLELESDGVQRLTAKTLESGAQLVARLRRQTRPAAVHRVADERRANVRHVHADLMRAARLELDLAMRVRAKALEHAIARARLAAALDDPHARALARMAADGSV